MACLTAAKRLLVVPLLVMLLIAALLGAYKEVKNESGNHK